MARKLDTGELLEYEKPIPYMWAGHEMFLMWGKPDPSNKAKDFWIAPTLEDLWKIYG